MRGTLALTGTLAGLAPVARAAPPTHSLRPLRRPVAISTRAAPGAGPLISAARLGGEVSFAVVDARSGEVLEGYAPRTAQPPASVTKAVTALYALDAMGGDHRFVTRLIATGPVKDGVLEGDLVLAGGGDPSLDTDALAELAAELKATGLREVTGRFRVWDGALPYTRAIADDQPEHAGYNPAVSGLALNFNRVHFGWKRAGNGWSVSMDARSARYRPAVRVARMRVENRAGPVYGYDDAGSHDQWTVAAGALGSGGARWLPVRKPARYAGEVFAGFARAHGIVLNVPGRMERPPRGTALARHESPPLVDMLREMLKYSNNLMAEMVGMSATAARAGRAPASLRASARAMSEWAADRLDMDDARLVDHSGLGVDSRLSALGMARALAAARRHDALKPILKQVKLRDVRGRKLSSHPLKVRAKTGTLFFVSALAGYVTAPGGRELAFAIFTADTERRAALDTRRLGRPRGARSWNVRAKILQSRLIERWGDLFAG